MTSNNETLGLINQARAAAQKDTIKRFFSKNSKTISTLLILIFIGAIGFFAYNSYKKSQAEKFSEILHQSLLDQQAGEFEKAKENLKKIYQSSMAPSGVKSLASLRYAGFLLEEGKKEEAIKVYQEVNDCRFCDAYVKDLAGLLVVKLWIADESELKKEDLTLRIEKIENKASPLKFHIAEQRAILEMYKGNLEKSYQIFELIEKSSEVSPNLKTRAADGLKMLIGKGYIKKDA